MLQELIASGNILGLEGDLPITVLYHYPCRDGFAAQYTIWQQHYNLHKSTWIPAKYGEAPPFVEHDQHVILVDICFPPDEMTALARPGNIVTVLDHHKTALERVARELGTPNRTKQNQYYFEKELPHSKICYYFDMDRSGAGIAWNYVMGNDNLPRPLAEIQRRDLWKHSALDDQIILAVDTYKRDNKTWESMMESEKKGSINLKKDGGQLITYRDNLINWDLMNVSWYTLQNEWTIPALNTSQFCSEIGNILCQKFPGAPFSITWYVTKDHDVKISFRSIGDFDVSEVASLFGGGGHRNASGAIISSDTFTSEVRAPSWEEMVTVLTDQPVTI